MVKFSDGKWQHPQTSQLIIFSNQEPTSWFNWCYLFTCDRKLLKNFLKAAIYQSTSSKVTDVPGHIWQSWGWAGKQGLSWQTHRVTANGLGQGLGPSRPCWGSTPGSSKQTHTPGTWHSPQVSLAIQLPRWEPHLSWLWILECLCWLLLAVTSQWFQRK